MERKREMERGKSDSVDGSSLASVSSRGTRGEAKAMMGWRPAWRGRRNG